MADLTVKQHDTWPPVRATLSDASGPIDLTGATQIKLILKGATVTITGNCTVVSAPAGTVSYTWAAGDTAVAGDYQGEFEITWPGGKVETVPNDSYLAVTIKADLG